MTKYREYDLPQSRGWTRRSGAPRARLGTRRHAPESPPTQVIQGMDALAVLKIGSVTCSNLWSAIPGRQERRHTACTCCTRMPPLRPPRAIALYCAPRCPKRPDAPGARMRSCWPRASSRLPYQRPADGRCNGLIGSHGSASVCTWSIIRRRCHVGPRPTCDDSTWHEVGADRWWGCRVAQRPQ